MNCDDTYQRFTLEDRGIEGRVARLDVWSQAGWVTVYTLEGGDPMERQIEPTQAGFVQFSNCRRVLAIPLIYTGSGANLELVLLGWNGSQVVELLHTQEKNKGSWWVEGDNIKVSCAVFLFNEPNCCPCNRETVTYTWKGDRFEETARVTTPVYQGTPPPDCVPTPTPTVYGGYLNPGTLFIATPFPWYEYELVPMPVPIQPGR